MYKQLIVLLSVVSLMACSTSRKSTSSPVKTEEAEIREQFNTYFQTVEQGDYEKTMDYIYPKLFDMVPKEAMLQAMEQINSDPSIQITMDSSSIHNVSEVLRSEDQRAFARVDYVFRMIMQITPETEEDDEEEEEEEFNQFDFTADMLEGVYGSENVRRDKKKQLIYIRINSSMFAINDAAYPGWKFLEKKEQMEPILGQLIPAEVLEKL